MSAKEHSDGALKKIVVTALGALLTAWLLRYCAPKASETRPVIAQANENDFAARLRDLEERLKKQGASPGIGSSQGTIQLPAEERDSLQKEYEARLRQLQAVIDSKIAAPRSQQSYQSEFTGRWVEDTSGRSWSIAQSGSSFAMSENLQYGSSPPWPVYISGRQIYYTVLNYPGMQYWFTFTLNPQGNQLAGSYMDAWGRVGYAVLSKR